MTYAQDFGDAHIGKLVLIDYPLHVTKSENENFMGLIIGSSGKGKTWAAVRLAEQLDPTFDIDRVCVTYQEFLAQLESMAQAWDRKEDVAGKVILFDEFQKSVSARKFMSRINQAINDVLFTFRYLNLIVLFTTPQMSFVDINSRAMMHLQVVIVEKRKELGLTKGEIVFNQIKNNPHDPSDKLFHYAPRVFTDDGVFKVKYIWFEKPSARMQRLVDSKVNEFKHSVLTDSIAQMDQADALDDKKSKTSSQRNRDWANEIFIRKSRYYNEHTKKWDKGAIMLEYPDINSSRWQDIRPVLNAMLKFGVKPGDIEMPKDDSL